MRARWPFVGALLVLAVGYTAYPYVTLFRLGQAIRGGDTVALAMLVNWPSVREGIKEDICDFVLDQPAGGGDSNELPAFGASFVRGVTSSTIDQSLTPQNLVTMVGHAPTQEPEKGADVRIGWAFFSSPTSFALDLHAEGPTEPIRVEMTLERGAWRVSRVWLPVEMLQQAGAKT